MTSEFKVGDKARVLIQGVFGKRSISVGEIVDVVGVDAYYVYIMGVNQTLQIVEHEKVAEHLEKVNEGGIGMSNKFAKGDKVRLNIGSQNKPKFTEEIYTVRDLRSMTTELGSIHIYTIESLGGKVIERIGESRLIPSEQLTGKARTLLITEDKVAAQIAKQEETSDYWLDTYNDNMALYEFFGDDEFLQNAIDAKAEWERRFVAKHTEKEGA